MFVGIVGIKAKAGHQQEMEKTFAGPFRGAISAQEGFRSVTLLRHNDSEIEYTLLIAFAEQALQQKWVATDLHEEVWPKMMEHFAEPFTFIPSTEVE